MASSDHSPADEAFERMLLRSASADGPPSEAASEAWAKLALAAAGTATLAAGSGLAATGLAAKKGGAWVAAKWLLIGAVGGSTATAALMRGGDVPAARGPRSAEAPVPSAQQQSATRVEPATSASEPALAPATAPRPAHATRVRAAHHVALPAPSAEPLRAPASRTSTLGAEVALLDAARKAIAMGAFDEALRLIGDYRRTFPGGALAADAEVIAIDSMTARHADVTVQADRFLSRFPNDPHAARIRKLSSSPPPRAE